MDYNNYNNYNNSGESSSNNYGSYRGGSGNSDDVVSIGTWVGIMLLTGIPIVNIIALIVMAVSQGNQNIRNFAKAALIMLGIGLVLSFLFAACSGF